MTRKKAATTVNAGVAGATAGIPAQAAPRDAERRFLVEQVERMERKVARAAADLLAAEEALMSARSQLASFTGDADG